MCPHDPYTICPRRGQPVGSAGVAPSPVAGVPRCPAKNYPLYGPPGARNGVWGYGYSPSLAEKAAPPASRFLPFGKKKKFLKLKQTKRPQPQRCIAAQNCFPSARSATQREILSRTRSYTSWRRCAGRGRRSRAAGAEVPAGAGFASRGRTEALRGNGGSGGGRMDGCGAAPSIPQATAAKSGWSSTLLGLPAKNRVEDRRRRAGTKKPRAKLTRGRDCEVKSGKGARGRRHVHGSRLLIPAEPF